MHYTLEECSINAKLVMLRSVVFSDVRVLQTEDNVSTVPLRFILL